MNIAIYYIPDFLVFLFGLACFLIAVRWPAQPGKKTFVAFVVVAFLLIPLIRMVSWPLLWMIEGQYRRPNYWTGNIGPLLPNLFSIIAALLLLIYAVFRTEQIGAMRSGSSDGQYRSFRHVESTDLRFLDFGPKWDVDVSSRNRVSIARRREWAFLIDFSPIFIWMIIFAIGGAAVQWGLSVPAWLNRLTVTLTMMSIPAAVAYWIFKDSADGISFGKWMTQCRVVCKNSGKPIDARKSVLRNLVFLLPLGPLVELAVSSLRNDRRRIGDLIAGTVVVKGVPRWIDGVEVEMESAAESEQVAVPHPLDD